MSPKGEEAIRYHSADGDAKDERNEADPTLRSRGIMDGLKLDGKGVKKWEIGAGKEENINEIGKNCSVLEKVMLNHCFGPHKPFVQEQCQHKNNERCHGKNRTRARPVIHSRPMHRKYEARQCPGDENTTQEVELGYSFA